jgi:hypothetical protein
MSVSGLAAFNIFFNSYMGGNGPPPYTHPLSPYIDPPLYNSDQDQKHHSDIKIKKNSLSKKKQTMDPLLSRPPPSYEENEKGVIKPERGLFHWLRTKFGKNSDNYKVKEQEEEKQIRKHLERQELERQEQQQQQLVRQQLVRQQQQLIRQQQLERQQQEEEDYLKLNNEAANRNRIGREMFGNAWFEHGQEN